MCILQIGELCKLVSNELRNEETRVPWKEWCGIRDVFAHQYSDVDLESAWDTIHNDMPQLEKDMKRIYDKIK